MLICNHRHLTSQRKQTQRNWTRPRSLNTKSMHHILNSGHYNVARGFKINNICDWMSKNVIHILSIVETNIHISHNKIQHENITYMSINVPIG